MIITIEYKATKSTINGYKPNVYVNGKWRYTAARNAKTEKGALNRAKKLAKEIADDYRYNNQNQVTVKPKEG